MGSIITMRLIFILLALGMLLGVRGQASMFDEYWFNEFHGQGYGLRALVPVGTMLSMFISVAIQPAMEYIGHSLSRVLNPGRKPFTIDTSNAEDPRCNGLALVLYQPFLATGAVVPAAATALAPKSSLDHASVTANVTDGSIGALTLILMVTPVGTSDADEPLCNEFAVVPYRPFLAVGAVEPAAMTVLVPASNFCRSLVIVAVGGTGLPTMIPASTAVTSTTASADLYGSRAVVVYRPIDLMATVVPATTGVRIKFTYVSTSTSVSGGGDDALAAAIISMETTSADQCLALILYQPSMVVTTPTPAITAAGVAGMHGHMSHASPPADTHPHAPTGRSSPPTSEAESQAGLGGQSAPVVEVSAGFNGGVDTSTPVIEVPTTLDDGAEEVKTLVAPVTKVAVRSIYSGVLKESSSKDSSQVSPQSLAVSVLPRGVHALLLAALPSNVHSLLLAFNKLDAAVSAFLWDSWSTFRESIGTITRQGEEEHTATPTSLPPSGSHSLGSGRGLTYLTHTDIWASLRGLVSWCLLSPAESTIEKAPSSFASWIWSSTLGQGVLFIVAEVSSPGWGCFGRSAFDAFIAGLVARRDLVVLAIYLSFLLLLGSYWVVVSTANLKSYFGIGSQNDGERPARDGRVRSPRGRRRGKCRDSKKADAVARGLRPPGNATGVPAKARRSRDINARRLKGKGW